ncbi:uracil-DNA glycosylase [endosymbiont GvMRE of Glomus versiforme]|uniref:uracil-DNA glycosylase n=1 Tax=endosymbiont GvMRE of Glomus versiforme TaxID=2039283 RepID=UPI00155892D8|nr:uracil-DNA glycosylase [endosymbiont GvMRE of Glomus versiforme]
MFNNNFLEEEFCLNKIKPGWFSFFQQEIQKEYFLSLLTEINKEYQKYTCWPRKENVFRLFREISLDKIKVVILGQDPYHSPEVADGIAFSTQKPNYIPPSLVNIFLEFSEDLNCACPTKSDLLPWVKEGVFLLNTALTVRGGQALSHMKTWEEFTYSLLDYLNHHDRKIIWVLWGRKAQEIGEKCGISKKNACNCLVISSHPSPYSAEHGFFGSRPFSKTNQLLSEAGKEPVNWLSILEPSLKKSG